MERYTLKANRREVIGKQVGQLRRQGKLPAVLYGRHMDKPIAITLDQIEASKTLRHITYSSLLLVNLDGEEHNALVRDFQIDTIKGHLTHVDLLVVSLTEKVRAEVGIIMDGKAPVIANLGGLLVTGLERVDVESLPQDLPEHFTVDVTKLANFGDAIFVRDLIVPANVTILSDPDELLIVATAPVTELVEVAAPVAAVAEGAAAEGAAAEGAAPAAGDAAAEGDKKAADKK